MTQPTAQGWGNRSWPATAALIAAVTAVTIWLHFVAIPYRISAPAYGLALLLGLWHRDRALLWAMAGCFVVSALARAIILPPNGAYGSSLQPLLNVATQWLNILVPAAVVHIVLAYRRRLVRSREALQAEIVERTRAEERTRLLSEVTAELLASEEPQRLVESLCRRIMDHLDCQVFFNFLVDEPTGRLRLNASAGISQECARQVEWLELGAAICGAVAQENCGIVAERIQAGGDPRVDFVRSLGVEAYACYPLLNQGSVIGTLSFGSRSKTSFSDDELALMRAVADKVAITLQRLRLLEAVRQRAAEAEEANRAKDRFVANISHELRTPMNAILGMIDLALPRVSEPTARDFLQTAGESADLLLALLNDLLDCAKLESGKLQIEPAVFSLRQVLEQTTRALAVRAAAKRLYFDCRLAPDMPDALVGDAVRFRQVVLNLAGNAIKFTERGEVEIRGRLASVDGEQACLEFAVRDTGIGISESQLQHIFQPFTQADSSTSRRFGGTGLGLSIAAGLVNMMGGEIRATSQPGAGSTFRFTVRMALAKEPLPGADLAAAPEPAAACLRILLVEDNPANQKLAAHLLRGRGHAVEIAGDGYQALRMIDEHPYDAVLMDVQMPGLDGLQTTAAIRARERRLAEQEERELLQRSPSAPAEDEADVGSSAALSGRLHVPIIAMTAHAMNGDRERCLAAGMDGYLPKPVDAAALFRLVESLASGVTSDCPRAAGTGIGGGQPDCRPVEAFDHALALRQCCGDPRMLGEMVECLFADADRLLPQMHVALECDDLAEVARMAHRLKGTLVYLGARPATDAAIALERFRCGGSKEEAGCAVHALREQVERLEQTLAAYRPIDAADSAGVGA